MPVTDHPALSPLTDRPLQRCFVGGIAAVVSVALLAVTAQGAGAANSAFYTPPVGQPAANGALIRTEPMKLGISLKLPGTAATPGTATRIMFRSTDSTGAPVAVTGVYIEPSKRYGRGGPRPLVVYAPGTQGQGDQCAPSLSLETPLIVKGGSVSVGYETIGINGLLNRGLAVVVPDYMGLGTPGRVHTYVNRVDIGRAVLDAARAALTVPGASVNSTSPVGTFGYSQGGGATAAAAELAPTYAPDVNLKAVYSGAPPADLMAVMKTADHTMLTGVIGFAINGLVNNYPALKPILDAETNAGGKAVLSRLSQMCIGDIIFKYAFTKTSQWTTSRKSVSQIVESNPTALSIVNEQRIGTIAPQVPVRVLTGTKDDIVGHLQDKQLALDWCKLGANVSYVPVAQKTSSNGTMLNHLGPMLSGMQASQSWLAERLAGAPAASNCTAVPALP